ncbi:hypothetical protein RND81_12G199900 [Saponaria officinalis]|uniref:THH1/TOM1/TOM3 domain-containing protein n=1 Tax=Saponaria officinalis TaxID=3572 RepID=A0AAW1HD56_SAPOF
MVLDGITRPELMSESTQWQHTTFYAISAAYALLSALALIQLIRIQLRVHECGWTTQKVFHFMNFIVNAARAAVFGSDMFAFVLRPKVLTLVLLHLPVLFYFTTYTLLVLFWAEIYYQARDRPTDRLKVRYISVNCVVYVFQILIWVYLWLNDDSFVGSISQLFIAVVPFIAALGFLLYGTRLFLMLKRFPIDSRGRRNKLFEVGSVTAICVTCFLAHCVMEYRYTTKIISSIAGDNLLSTVDACRQGEFSKDSMCMPRDQVAMSAFDADASPRVLNHPLVDLICYTLTEILPSAFVLFILRKLPAKRD